VLDPRTKPASSWANLVDAVTEEATATPPAANPERLQAELADAQRTPELLVAWLIRAIDALNTTDLVALRVPLRQQLEHLGEETLSHPDRRLRRRVHELVRRVSRQTVRKSPLTAGRSRTRRWLRPRRT
jgi:hypothetical protein